MLGWEFPPHISGGLGTACAGLAQALEKQQVDVLFVVPKLHGGEHAERTRFVSASAIPIHQTIAKNNLPVHAHSLAIGGLQGPAGKHNATEPKKSGHKTTIEIPSQLSPYAFPHTVETTYSVERWNYSFGHTAAKTTTYPGHAAGRKHNVRAKHTTEPYPFTGGYGPNLFEEVER